MLAESFANCIAVSNWDPEWDTGTVTYDSTTIPVHYTSKPHCDTCTCDTEPIADPDPEC